MVDNILSCQNITIKYDAQIAVKEVSFALNARDYLCIIGENGSGKSTLLKGILHLLPLSGGRVTLRGVKETQIGYLPQQTKTQKDFPANVYEVVLSGCLNKQKKFFPFYSRQDKKSAAENLARLGLEKLAAKSYRELSGGEQQRVLLARALCAAEKVLLLDEPFAGLDPSASAAMYSLLQKLNSQMGMTIIMISHDLKHAVKHANKILHLQKKPLYFGQKEDYLQTALGKTMLGVEGNV